MINSQTPNLFPVSELISLVSFLQRQEKYKMQAHKRDGRMALMPGVDFG